MIAQGNPLRGGTQLYDAETDLYCYQFRYYSPATGRWLSRDPLGEAGGRNLYAFCGNNPLNSVDLLGLCGSGTGSGEAMSANSFYEAAMAKARGSNYDESMVEQWKRNGAFDAMARAYIASNGFSVDILLTSSDGNAVFINGGGNPQTHDVTGAWEPVANHDSSVNFQQKVDFSQFGGTSYSMGSTSFGNTGTEQGQRSYDSALAPDNAGTPGTYTVSENSGVISATTASQPGYWDRFVQHVEHYAITVPPAVGETLLGGGAMPKSWVPWTGGRGPALGSNNPLTSVPRAVFGSNAVTTNVVARTGFAGIAITGAAIGSYNVGVLISGLVYAAFPGSNALPPPEG